MKETAKKTAGKSAGMARLPQPHGGSLLAAGVPGNKGGTGRPPKLFKEFLAELRSSPDAHDALRKAATDSLNRNFGNAWKLITDYDEDKPVPKTAADLTVTGGLTIRVVKE